ncbi:hypothetical protein PsorP6_008842 [Peronosclerospora sorghi]|uniref:Uncharacterized protein n=1 Tax=Peronosclerospora sorghi TaxID=230839 RepID=A0ACC0VYL0_9STRA|nr:hypothetical protein PsorP6_008842 [Peronosclerospora sorghi]
MNSHLWVIGVTLSLTATLFGTLGKVLLKFSHTSSQTLSPILAPMAGFSVVWNIMISPYLLNESCLRTVVILVGCVLVGVSGSHGTSTHRSAELLRLFESRIFVEYAAFAVFLAVAASFVLVAESGSIWYRPETYVIFVAALSSAGGGIDVLDLGQREHDALYLVAIYQAFLILIGSFFFDGISGMNTRWKLVVYPFSIATTVGGIIVLSEKHTKHCDPVILSARCFGAKEGEISPLIISQNDRVKHGVKRGFVDIF